MLRPAMTDSVDLRTASGLLALQQLPRVGPTTALKAALQGSLARATRTEPLADIDLTAELEWAEDQIARYRDAGVEPVDFFDSRYPQLLSQIAAPPPILFTRGNLALLSHPRPVAVVGTREPSTFGTTAAGEITRTLAEAGWAIVSGLAAGIDSLAHQTALRAGAPTIAVVGNGLERVYPKANEKLAAEILDRGGLLLSEQPYGAPPIPRNLIARDRIQSGLARAVVVVQTGLKGGTMHTVRSAAEQGRPVFSPLPHDENGKSEGIRALLERPANELCELLPAWRQARGLCARLGARPLARPIEKHTLSKFLDDLELGLQDAQFAGQQLLFAETNA